MKITVKKIRSFLQDLFLVAGFSAIAWGLFSIYHPAAFVVCGSLLIYAGIPKREKRRRMEIPTRTQAGQR